MSHCLHVAKNFQKRLEELRKKGKKGVLAADLCQTVISRLGQGDLLDDLLISKRTKNGEYRVEGCVKYDLGNGYRLVTVKQRHHIFITFAGNHDQTDKWIESHRYDRYTYDDPAFCLTNVSWGKQEHEELERAAEEEELFSDRDPYEDELLARVDESVMKSLFQGLFR